MANGNSRKSSTKQAIAGTLALVYFVGNVALSHATETNLWDQRRHDVARAREAQAVQVASLPSVLSEPLSLNLPSISRPSHIRRAAVEPRLGSLSFHDGNVREIWTAPQSKMPPVVLVQDVHLNSEAQERIAGILAEIDRTARANGGASLVGVEGASGSFDFRRFRAFPDRKLTETVARFYLLNDTIAAPSFVGLTRADAPVFAGIDDSRYYDRNVAAYRDALPARDGVRDALKRLSASVEAEKRTMNPSLRELDLLIRAYGEGKLGLASYVRGVERLVARVTRDGDEERDLVIEQFLAACDLEARLDLPKIEREKGEALRLLAERAKPAELADLAALAVAYRSGRFSYGDFFGALRGILEKNAVPLERLPAFDGYLRYIALAEGINASKLFAAVRSLDRRAVNALAANAGERELMERSRELALADKLVDFALTPDEWQEYKQRFQTLRPVSGEASILEAEFASVRARLETFESFYRYADFRSARLVENLLSEAKSSGAPIAAMVIGGFHTPAVAQALRGRGVSYAVVQARLTKVEAATASDYLTIFSREETPLEKLLSGERLYLAPTAVAVGNGARDARPATRKILAPLAVGNAVLPKETGVTRRDLGAGVMELAFAEGGTLAVSLAAAPRRFVEIESVAIPGLGVLRYLASRPSIRESWFALLPLAASIAFGAPGIGASAVALSAILFVSIHDNRVDGAFSAKRFAVRAVASFAILAIAWSGVSALGILANVAFSVTPLNGIGGITIGLATLIAAILHEGWNMISGPLYQLAITSDESERERREHAARLQAFPAMARLLADTGTPFTNLERAAIRRYLRVVHGQPAAAGPFRLTERVIRILQDFELAEFQEMARRGFASSGQAGLETARAVATRRLQAIQALYQQSNVANADALIEEVLSGATEESWIRATATVAVSVPGRPTLKMPVLAAPAAIAASRQSRAVAEAVRAFEEAEGASDFRAMAAALARVPVGESAHRDLAARLGLAFDQRFAASSEPADLAAFADDLPEPYRGQVLARAAQIAQSRIDAATTSDEISSMREFLPEGDARRRAENLAWGFRAAEHVLEAPNDISVTRADIDEMRRRLPEDHPVRLAAERHYAALQAGRLPVARPATAETEEAPAETVTPVEPAVPAAPARPRRDRLTVAPGQQEALADFETEFRAIRTSAEVRPLIDAIGDDALTNAEYNALRYFLLNVHGLRLAGFVPAARLSPRLVRAIRAYELRRLRALLEAAPATEHAAILAQATRRRDALLSVYTAGRSTSADDRALEALSDDTDVFLKGTQPIVIKGGSRFTAPVVAARSEIVAANFDRAERAGDAREMAQILRAQNDDDIITAWTERLRAVLLARLPSISDVGTLADLYGILSDTLRPLVVDREVELGFARLAAADTAENAEGALNLIPRNHPRRDEAARQADGVNAALEIQALGRRADVTPALVTRLSGAPATNPARVAAEARIAALNHEAAREQLRDGIAMNDVDLIRDAIPNLPDAERPAAETELRQAAMRLVRGAPNADNITDDLISMLDPAQQAPARAFRDALRAAAGLAVGDAEATPSERLRAARRRLTSLNNRIERAAGLARLTAQAALLRFAISLRDLGLMPYFHITDAAIGRFQRRLIQQRDLLIAACNAETTLAGFEARYAELQQAFDVFRREGLVREMGLPSSDASLDMFERRVWRQRHLLFTAMIDGLPDTVGRMAPRFLRQLRDLQLNDEGRFDGDAVNAALSTARVLQARAAALGDRASAIAEALLMVQQDLERLANAINPMPRRAPAPVASTPATAAATPSAASTPASSTPAPASTSASSPAPTAPGAASVSARRAAAVRLPPPARSNWRLRAAAIIFLVVTSGMFGWFSGWFGRPTSTGPTAIPPAAVAPKDVVRPALPPIFNAGQPAPAGVAALDPSALWQDRADRQQTARADMLDTSLRVLALTPGARAADAYVAEIPQLARTRGGVPIQTLSIGGKAHLLLDDGSTIAITRGMQHDFETKGHFTPPMGRRFVTLDLSNMTLPEAAIGGLKSNVARFAPRAPITVAGKNIDVTAIPIGVDGRPVVDPADGWSRPRFFTKDRQPPVGLQARSVDPVTGETNWTETARMPAGASPSDYRHYNRITGNHLMFLRPDMALETDRDNLVRLERRLGILKELADRADIVAVEVNDKNEIVNRFKKHDDVPGMVFYRRNPATLALEPYLPSDLSVDQSREPDMIRRAEIKGGRPVGGNEILFTLAGDLSVARAQLNAKMALTRATGTWATAAIPTAAEEANSFVTPVYMIIQDKVNGSYSVIYTKNQADFALSVRGAGLQALQGRVSPFVIQAMQMEMQTQVQFANGQRSEYETVRYKFTTNDSPNFETEMLDMLNWQRAQANVMAIEYDRAGNVTTRFNADVAGDDVALANRLKTARRTQGNFIYLKDGSTIVRNEHGRPIAFQVSEDFRVRHRTFMSNNPMDLRDLAALKAKAARQTNDFGVQVDFADGAIDAKAKNPMQRFAQDKTWLLNPSLGYEVDKAGKVTVFDDVKVLWNRLNGRDVINFEYVLADGTRVKWYDLKLSDVVTEIRDPKTKSSIYTGSEWLRLQYEMDIATMQDQLSRQGRNHFVRQTIIPTLTIGQVNLGALTTYSPAVAARSEVARQEYIANLGRIARDVEAGNLGPAQKAATLNGLRQMMRDANKGIFYTATGQAVITKFSDAEMLQWRTYLLTGMKNQQDYEQVRAAGGVIVTTNGEAYGRVSQLRQLYQLWGGNRDDGAVAAFPDWVPNDAASEADFRQVMKLTYNESNNALAKAGSKTRFIINDAKAARPVVTVAGNEYRDYIAELRKQLPPAEKAWRDAQARMDAAVGLKNVREARREYYTLRLEYEILVRQISDSERVGDATSPLRQQYVRETGKKKLADATEHVTIITPPANAAEQARRAERIAAERKEDLAKEQEVEQKGGVIVRGPGRSVYLVEGVAKDAPAITGWNDRMTGIIADRVIEERKLVDEWATLPPGPARDAAARRIGEIRDEIDFITRNNVFTWKERGVTYVIEMKFGVAAARAGVARQERAIAEAASARDGMLSGMVITRPKAGGLPRIETARAEVERRQKELAAEMKKVRAEYDGLMARPMGRDEVERAKALARQIRENVWYEDADNVYYVLGGFRGAQNELFQLQRENLRPNEILVEEVDVLGVRTGRAVIWMQDRGVWKEDRLYEPYMADSLGRARVKVSPIVDSRVDARGVKTYRTATQSHIDTIEIAQLRAPTGETYLATRPIQRETFRFSAGGVETWTRTTMTYLNPESDVIQTSQSFNFTRRAGAPENTAVLEADPVMTRKVVMDGAAPKRDEGNYVYDVVYGKGAGIAMDGQRREVHVDPITGVERKVFYPVYGAREGEVSILKEPGVYEVRHYKDGRIDMAKPALGTIRELSTWINGGRVLVRTDLSGRFIEAYAIDDTGRDVAAFFHRPQVVNGRPVFGRVVLDGNQTTRDLALLPQGREIIAARKYPDPAAQPLPVRQIFYFDESFNLVDAKGQLVPKDKAAENPAALAIQITDRFDRAAPEFYPGPIPTDWVFVDEVKLSEDAAVTRNRFFERTRAVDRFGRERASVAALPDGRFLVEFVNPAPPAPGQPVRVTYTADYEKAAGAPNGLYRVDRTAISTTFLHERPFTLDRVSQADWLIDGGMDLPAPIRGITSMVPQKDVQKEDMRRNLHAALKSISSELKAPGPLTLVVTAVTVRDGGTSYTARVKEDPYGRIVVFYSNENVIVNTAWTQASATDGFEYAKGLTFRIEADRNTTTAAQLLKSVPNGTRPHDLNRLAPVLKGSGIQTGEDIKLSRVTRYFRPDVLSAPGAAAPTEAQVRKTEIRVDSRYVMVGDPLVRNYAVESAGFIRFIRWDAPGVPFGVSAGEVVINVRSEEIYRNTHWGFHDPITGRYVYDVVNDPKDPRYIPVPEEVRKQNPDKIVFNYNTNMVYEVHSKEGYVVTSRDGFFLYTYHIDDNQAPSKQMVTGADGVRREAQLPYWDERHPSVRLYSEFVTRTWRSAAGDVYILISEEIVPGATEGTTPPTSYLIKNGQLVAKIVGRIEDPNAFVYTDLGGNESLFLDFYRKYYNSIPGLIANTVQSEILGEPTVRDIMAKIRVEGGTVQLTTHRPEMKPSFNLLTVIVQNGLWIGLSLLGVLSSIGAWLRFRRYFTRSHVSRSQKLFAGWPPVAGERDPRERFDELETVSGALVIPVSVAPADRSDYVADYFRENGFTDAEATHIATRYSDGVITFDVQEKDLKAEAAVPPLDELNAVGQVYTGSAGSFDDIDGKTWSGRRYGPAVVIQGLKLRGLITDGEITQAVREQSNVRGHAVSGALLWDNVMKVLLNQAQENALRRQIRKNGTAPLTADEIAVRNTVIDSLPLTPDANALRGLRLSGLVTMDEIADAARDNAKLDDVVNALIIAKVIDPTIEAIVARSYAGRVADNVKAEIRTAIIAEMLPFIKKNPGLLVDFAAHGDMVYNAHPMVKAIEPMTLREYAILRFVQLNPSQTIPAGGKKAFTSIGQFSAMWPFSMYVVRQIDAALKAGKTQDEILKMVDDLATTMILTIQDNIKKFDRVTKRDAHRSPEEMALAGIEAALKKRTPAAGIVTAADNALKGKVSDALRAATVLEVSRLLDESADAAAIATAIEANMQTALPAGDPQITAVIAAVQAELDKRIAPADRMKEIEPLFNGRPEAATLSAAIRAELDAAETAGALPDVKKIMGLVILSDQKLVDLFIDLDLWDLFEFVQDKGVTVEAAVGMGTMAQLRAMAEGTQAEKDNLGRGLKETTLRLSEAIHPEATARDRGTKRRFEFRRGQFGVAVALLAVAFVPAYFGLLPNAAILGVAGVAAVIGARSFRLAGTGLIALYLSIPRALISLTGFWNMNRIQRIGYAVTSVAAIAGAVALVFFHPNLFAAGLALGATVVTLLPIVWAGNFPWKEKIFFGGIVGGAGAYVTGLLTYHLFWKIAVIDPFTFGFFTTLLLLVLTLIPTVISTYHFFLAIRSYYHLNTEVWSDTARGLTGWRSMNPFRGFLRGFVSTHVPFAEFRNQFLGIATLGYMVGAVATFLVAPLSFIIFTAAFIVGAGVVYQILRFIKTRMQADVADFWELTYGKWFAEFQRVERSRKALLANGEPVGRYFERLVVLLHQKYLISDEERSAWIGAARGESDGRFVRPQSLKAQEILRDAFNAISQRKPAPDPLALMQAASTHVQAYGELFTHTFENCALLGTFNTMADGRRTTLLGYVARTHPVEWGNLLQRVRGETFTRFGRTPVLALGELGRIDETTDLYRMFYQRTSPEDLTAEERAFIIGQLMAWMNEMRPNNDAVMASMAQDIAEFHMLAAMERGSLRDSAYRAAVEEISLRGQPLPEAYRTLSATHATFFGWADAIRAGNPALANYTIRELFDHLNARRATLPAGSAYQLFVDAYLGLDSHGRNEILFVEFFPRTQPQVETRLRAIFQDAALWGAANFTAENGGRNIANIGGLQNLIKGLSAWANNLPDTDPVKAELLALLPGLKVLDPKDATATDKAPFATMEAWSAAFLAWRTRVETGATETNGDRLLKLLNLFSTVSDAALIAPQDLSPDSLLADGNGIKTSYANLIQFALTVMTASNAGLLYAFADNRVDGFFGIKHAQMGGDLWRFFGRTVDYDAHVMVEYGQNAFRPFWAAMNSQQRNPQYAAINPKMFIWASLGNAFPATRLYAIAQTVWTSDVQRALREYLLDYGKYMGIPQTIGPLTPPGEDSQGLLMLQRSASRKGVFYTGTQIDWFSYRWGRPSLFAESLLSTEMRYAFNVTVFLASRGSYSVFFNKNVPTQVKLVHLFLWMHYLIAPFALALLILLPALSPFSAFAFLKPFFFFVAASFILMEAININNFNRHWREQGNFFTAMWLTIVDLTVALPMYVSLIPFFFRGVWLAADEMFSFIRTVKEAYLAALPDGERFDSFMLFSKFKFALPLNALVGFAGVAAWFGAFLMMTPYGPIILIPYLMASLAMIAGIYALGVFPTQGDRVKGYRFELVSALGAFVGALIWTGAFIMLFGVGPLAWGSYLVVSLAGLVLLWKVGFFHHNGIVRTAWVMQRSLRAIPLNYYVRFVGFSAFIAGIAFASSLGLLGLMLYLSLFPAIMRATGLVADLVDKNGKKSGLEARRRAAEDKALRAGLEPEVARVARSRPDDVDRMIVENDNARRRVVRAAADNAIPDADVPVFDYDAAKKKTVAVQRNEWSAKQEIIRRIAAGTRFAILLLALGGFLGFMGGASQARAQQPAAATRLVVAESGVVRPIRSPKQAIEFLDLQRMGANRPTPSLPATFHVPANSKVTFVDDDHKLIIERGVGTYDVALAVMLYVEQGDLKKAREILDIYSNGHYGDYTLGAFPTAENKGAFAPFDANIHYVFNFTDVTGKYTPKWSFWNVHTGPNAWLVMAAARYAEANGGYNARQNASVKQLIDRIGGAMLRMQFEQGGMRYGPKGQYDMAAGKNTDGSYYYSNSENNVSSYAAFRSLSRVTGDRRYGAAADRIRGFMKDGEIWVPGVDGKFTKQNGLLNKDTGTMFMGAKWSVDNNRFEAEMQFATDSAGSWTLLSLGIEDFDRMFGAGAAYRAYETMRAKAGRTNDYSPARPGDDLMGIDYTDKINGRVIGRDSGLRSNEWGAAFARQREGKIADSLLPLLIAHYMKNPTDAVNAAALDGLRRDYRTLGGALYADPNPYADGPGLTGWRAKLGVGFEGGTWIPPHRDITATASLYLQFVNEPLAWWRDEAAPATIEAPRVEPKKVEAKIEPKVEPKIETPAVKTEPKAPVVKTEPKARAMTPVVETPAVEAPKKESHIGRYVFIGLGLAGASIVTVLVLRQLRKSKEDEPSSTGTKRPDPLRRALLDLDRAQDLLRTATDILPSKTEKDTKKIDASDAALSGMSADARGEALRLLVDAAAALDAAIDGLTGPAQARKKQAAEKQRTVVKALIAKISPKLTDLGGSTTMMSLALPLLAGLPLGDASDGVSVPLLVPVLAIWLIVGAVAGLLILIARNRLTVRVSVPTPPVAPMLRDFLSTDDPAKKAAALDQLISAERLGLGSFGRVAGRDRAEALAEAFGIKTARTADQTYFMNGVALARPDSVTTVKDALAETSPVDLFVPKPAASAEALAADIARYRAVSGRDAANVLLIGGNEAFADAALRQVGTGTVLRASEINGGAALEKALTSAGASLRRLRVLADKDAILPPNILDSLIELGRRSDAPIAVEVLILAALTAEAIAIRAGVDDLEGLVSFRRLLGTQA